MKDMKISSNQQQPQSNQRMATYPWEDWTDGVWREATVGEDFTCKPQSFAVQVHKYARTHGLTANTEVEPWHLPAGTVRFRLARPM